MSTGQSITSKLCLKCRAVKPAEDFGPEPRNLDGLQGSCRVCRNALRKTVAEPPAGYVKPTSKPRTTCKIDKPLRDYSPDVRNRDGKQTRCKECGNARIRELGSTAEGREMIAGWEKRSKIKHRYGITGEDFERILAEQGGVCAICKNPPHGRNRNHHRLHVDHCHATGKVRGLLCNRCNVAIAAFGDTSEGVMRAVAYLRRSESP